METVKGKQKQYQRALKDFYEDFALEPLKKYQAPKPQIPLVRIYTPVSETKEQAANPQPVKDPLLISTKFHIPQGFDFFKAFLGLSFDTVHLIYDYIGIKEIFLFLMSCKRLFSATSDAQFWRRRLEDFTLTKTFSNIFVNPEALKNIFMSFLYLPYNNYSLTNNDFLHDYNDKYYQELAMNILDIKSIKGCKEIAKIFRDYQDDALSFLPDLKLSWYAKEQKLVLWATLHTRVPKGQFAFGRMIREYEFPNEAFVSAKFINTECIIAETWDKIEEASS